MMHEDFKVFLMTSYDYLQFLMNKNEYRRKNKNIVEHIEFSLFI